MERERYLCADPLLKLLFGKLREVMQALPRKTYVLLEQLLTAQHLPTSRYELVIFQKRLAEK